MDPCSTDLVSRTELHIQPFFGEAIPLFDSAIRAVEQWAALVATEAGFTDVGHTVELFGLCPECAS